MPVTMILIPQIYLKNGKVAGIDERSRPVFQEDPLATARAVKEAGAVAVFCVDLGIPPVGQSPHLPVIKFMRDELGLEVYASGAFKTMSAIDNFITNGADFVTLGNIAYQQPAFLEEACRKFPNKIAANVDVKSSHVTIPGYAVGSNKTALDYAEQFMKSGVRHILYSDVAASGVIAEENFANISDFCKRVTARVVCTSEVSNLGDIERLVTLGVPRLDGLVLSKSIHEGRIDLGGAIAMANDLSIKSSDEMTIAEI